MQRGYDTATGQIDTGLGQLTSAYGQAQNYFTPLANAAGGGFQAYANATGANGQAGLDSARSLFTQTPGYTEGLNRTLDQVDRRAASRGMLNSGNTLDETAKVATNYANQNYGDYVSRLSPFLSTGAGIAGQQAAYTAAPGQAAYGAGITKGNLGYNTQTGIGNANASYELSKDQTGLNQLGGLTSLAKIAGAFV